MNRRTEQRPQESAALAAKLALYQNSSDALSRHLCQYTVAFVSNGKPGSGTYVTLGSRLFIVTAAHVLPKSPVDFWLLSHRVRANTDPFPTFVRMGGYPRLDVGYLEFPCDETLEFASTKPCTIHEMDLSGAPHLSRPVTLMGAPADRAIRRHGRTTFDYIARVRGYSTVSLQRSEWPAVPSDSRRSRIDVDIFLSYPEAGITEAASMKPVRLGDAPGLSGGGIWDQGLIPGAVWTPGSARLFAIQSSWHRTKRYVRGTLLSHWARLVSRDYPDLRDLIRAEARSRH